MGTSGNRDCQCASRSVLTDFTEHALNFSGGRLFRNGIARTLKVPTASLFNGTCRRGRVVL